MLLQKHGFLCKMDDVNNFVEKIRIPGENADLRKRMGEYNKKKILEKFTLSIMVKEYVEIYKKFV